jgi:hypothetical protein
MARDLNMFDKADSERIRQSLLEYARSAVAEWPEAANGRTMPAAENALTQLYTTYENIEPRDDKQRIFLTSSLDSLKQMSLARTQRLLTARTNTGPPLSLWGVIFLTSGLVLAFSVGFSEKRAHLHYAMVTAASVLVAANLFLVTELSHPFLGEIGTSPEPLRAVILVLEPQ